MPDANTHEAFHLRPEWCRATLARIGDAVIATDSAGRITFLNQVAESLTGWTQNEAAGVPVEAVFKIVHPETRMPVESPAVRALREGVIVGLGDQTLLIAKDGTERPIGPVDDSAAPIRNDRGELAGVLLVFRDVTELRRQERAVRAALAYAESIIATLREPFIVLDTALRVKTANRTFYDTFYVEKEETEGRFIFDLGNGQWNNARLRTLLDEVLSEHHAVHDFHVEHDFPAIGKKVMLLNARRFEAVDGQSDLILLAIEDITERMRAEESLRQSEDRYRRLVDLMPAGVYTVDGAGLITFYNQQAAACWGRSPEIGDAEEQFCGAKRLFHADGSPLPHDETPVAAALRTGVNVRDMEVIIERPDGSRVQAEVNVAPIRDSADKIIGAINVFHDVSERKRAEAAVQTSEVRYRRLFQTAKDGILILDAKTLKIIDANPFMTELLGYTYEEFVGKELWEIGPFGDKSTSQAVYRDLQESGYIRYDHLPLETKDGKRAEVEFVSNVYQVDHRFVAQCNIRDISERSRLERKTLEQAQALADLHNRKDEFLAMLSHELRNPLAAILNGVQLLGLQKNEDRIQQKARAIIGRQVGQLTHLVDDLLEVSRITTGRIHLHLELVTLNGIVKNGVETTKPLIVERRHILNVSLPPEPIWLLGDASRLEQVVVNLLTNAAKYTDKGGHIALSIEQENEECVLKVRDSGVGIAPELLPRIFDLFTQAERSLDRSQGGLGIGLALVQRLVDMHGGKITVYSALGHGSEFVIRLPVIQSAETHLLWSPDKAPAPTREALRVLVVDDNLDTAESMAMLLEGSGHNARTAHDGLAAMEVALDCRPNLVLLDIGLPGLDGYEVARRLRQNPLFENTVLVAVTGYGQEADRQRSHNAGFDHHLVKPVDFGNVEEILASVSEKAN